MRQVRFCLTRYSRYSQRRPPKARRRRSALPAGQAYTTLEFKTNFVRAMTDRTGRVRAAGRVIHPGNRATTAEGHVYDGRGKLLAHATTTV